MTGIDTIEEAKTVLRHSSLTLGERKLIEWQFGLSGGFYKSLWETICRADESNLARLEKGFPSEVQAYRDFAHSGKFARKVKMILEQ